MPRQPRLDAPGLLQHVMARGIERREIFKDDKDRQSFLDRLAIILEETQTQYIHLNPIRAGLVNDLKELDKYPWSGHSTILGRRKNLLIPHPGKSYQQSAISSCERSQKPLAEKTVEDVLLYFGDKLNVARRRYRDFVKKGIKQGARPDLQGGGLVRNAGGNKSGLLGRKREDHEKGDERILGSGDFVSEVLDKAGESFEDQAGGRLSLEELIGTVARFMGIPIGDLKSSSRKRKLAHARSIVAYAAIRNLGYKATEVAEVLSLSPPTVSQNVEKGKIFLDRNEELKIELQIS